MFPTAPAGGTITLPVNAAFWMPRGDELNDDGIGFFQNTWLIKDVRVNEAWEIVEAERRIAGVVDHLSSDAFDFERIAVAAESAGVDDPAEDMSDEERDALREVVGSEIPELGCLELGVSGLVHALATVRVLPAASCRSHPERSWSNTPVVLVAITRFRAEALQPLAESAGCTFDIDETRPEFLVIRSQSIVSMMDLAIAVLENRRSFVQSRPILTARTRHSSPRTIQDPLF